MHIPAYSVLNRLFMYYINKARWFVWDQGPVWAGFGCWIYWSTKHVPLFIKIFYHVRRANTTPASVSH